MKRQQIEALVKGKGISPTNQKRVFARTSILMRLAIAEGKITKGEFLREEEAMMRDIDRKNEESITKELGLDDEGGG